MSASSIRAQSQAAVGNAMSFEVSSVKQDTSGKFITPPFSLDSDDNFTPTGEVFNATAPLTTYIAFAYKLDQLNPMIEQLPKWASSDRFEIHAKAEGNPTKDQLRLMMRSLLSDRFKLTLHLETRETQALSMVRIHPDKPSLGLRLHADGPACNIMVPRSSGAAPSIDMFPCNVATALNLPDHALIAGERNTTASQMAAFLSNVGHFGKPVVDKTGLTGAIDFAVTFTPEQPASDTSEFHGETLLEALKDQLGLKLVPEKLPLHVPVIDQLDRPSEN
jgi:uncharacterized protein (TIGR03435 family)